MEKTRLNKKYILRYTALFLLLWAAVLLPFAVYGKSLVWTTDGQTQYFPYLHYMGNYLRDFLEGLFHGELVPKMFDFAIGMGDDVCSVFRSHPLDFISAVVPGKYTELLYQFLIMLRIYLAGLSFSMFCFYWKKPGDTVLMGSMVYVFCGYVVKLGLRHPTFNAPIIILPLLLIGAEQVMRKKSILPFAFVTGLGFVSNYYFMYMCSIAMAVYVLLRFFDLYKEKRLRNFFCMGIRLAAGYLLGIGMVAVILFPTILRFLSSARADTQADLGNLWVYSNTKRYLTWIMDFISPFRGTGSNTQLNYAVLAVPAVVLLFVRKWREHISLKIAFLLEIAVLLIPAGGFVMGGFSNVNNRWVFILSFTVSFICVVVAEDFSRLSRAQLAVLGMVFLAYGGLYLYLTAGGSDTNRYWMAAVIELAVCMVIIFGLHFCPVSGNVWMTVLMALVCVSAAANGYLAFDPDYGNTVSEYEDSNTVLSSYETSPFAYFGRIQEDGFYRVDSSLVTSGTENGSIILGYRGISQYNSIINAKELDYLLDQESLGANAVHRIFSMGGSAVSEALANVKYFLTTEDGEGQVPYGFVPDETISGEEYKMYRNQYPLAFGYTYDTCIGSSDYEALGPLEKQQIMMEAVVLEDGADVSLERTSACSDNIISEKMELPEQGDNVKRTEKGYSVKQDGGSIELSFEKKAGYECYLHLKGMTRNKEYSFVDISTSDRKETVTLRETDGVYSLGRTDYMVNLGCSETDGADVITILFREKGSYKLDEIEICYVPMQNYVSRVNERNEEAMTDVTLGTNTVSGHVDLTDSRFMVFSVPFSDGWSVYVDGQKAELLRANVMYMGVMLQPGEHEIELRYCSPGIRAGAVVSIISWAVFLVMLIRNRKIRLCRKRKQAVQKEKSLVR